MSALPMAAVAADAEICQSPSRWWVIGPSPPGRAIKARHQYSRRAHTTLSGLQEAGVRAMLRDERSDSWVGAMISASK